jgi:subtilisin family serine protease
LFTDGSGVWSNVIAGIEFAVNSFMCRKKPAVINISISGPPSRALRDAVVSAVKLGIPVVVAAGNDEIDACGASPSNIKYNGVFVVGSINEQDEFSQFSNYGECVNILAPGEGVISAYTNPTGYPATNNYGAYMSGT